MQAIDSALAQTSSYNYCVETTIAMSKISLKEKGLTTVNILRNNSIIEGDQNHHE